jgi:hypothetical protein
VLSVIENDTIEFVVGFHLLGFVLFLLRTAVWVADSLFLFPGRSGGAVGARPLPRTIRTGCLALDDEARFQYKIFR